MANRTLKAGLALLAIAALAACAGYRDRQVEAAVLEALPRLLGPAERYEVSVRGADSSRSRLDSIEAVGIRVQRPKTPVLVRIEVVLRDVAVDLPRKQVTSIGEAGVSVRLAASDLAAHLVAQPWLRRPSVRFTPPADITVEARLTLPGVAGLASPPAQFRGHLMPRGSTLVLGIDAMSFGDRDALPIFRGLVEQAINPIVDVGDYAVPSRVDSVTVEGDELVIRASGSALTVRPPSSRP
jgi:hypothetical protein